MSNMDVSALDMKVVAGGPIDVNTYVVGSRGGDTCVLIDPGIAPKDLAEAIAGRSVSAILLTHAHFDHMLYAGDWLSKGAKLYVHAKDVPALTDPALNLCGMIGASLSLDGPVVSVQEGDVIKEAGLAFSVLHTPGHTPGSVCFACEGVLYSGDTMFYNSYGRTDFPGGNMAQMRTSLRRLCQMDERMLVYPGHGPKTKIAWERGMFL